MTRSLTTAPFIFAWLLLLPGCAPSTDDTAATPSPRAIDKTDSSATRLPETGSVQPKKVEFLVFTAKWCAVCKDVPPLLTRLKKEFPTVSFQEMDVDQGDNFQLYTKYMSEKESGLPDMFVVVDGKVAAHLLGLLPYERVAKTMREALGRNQSEAAAAR
jgi:thiol-disulfide isomerase/thioredoxin